MSQSIFQMILGFVIFLSGAFSPLGSSAFSPLGSGASSDMERVIEEYKPNELGEIMVVMYHNLVEKEEDEGYYARSYANFEKDLLRLHEEGYVPITMGEWIGGRIDVPAGKTPIVLTFDDGHSSDIRLGEDGKPTADSVVGIMEKVQKSHPDFVPKATFYLNGPAAFGDAQYDKKKISYLLSHGYEIGNHTSNHAHLNEIGIDQAKEEILSQAKRLEPFTKSKSFHFALPFGQKPQNYADLLRGNWLGEYRMLSSVNVGWNPIPSVYDKNFDPLNINRVTCGEDQVELYYWLENYKYVPEKRFYSDGNPDIISFPLSKRELFDEQFKKRGMKVLVYDDESLELLSKE